MMSELEAYCSECGVRYGDHERWCSSESIQVDESGSSEPSTIDGLRHLEDYHNRHLSHADCYGGDEDCWDRAMLEAEMLAARAASPKGERASAQADSIEHVGSRLGSTTERTSFGLTPYRDASDGLELRDAPSASPTVSESVTTARASAQAGAPGLDEIDLAIEKIRDSVVKAPRHYREGWVDALAAFRAVRPLRGGRPGGGRCLGWTTPAGSTVPSA
jgi:hypothetical protein